MNKILYYLVFILVLSACSDGSNNLQRWSWQKKQVPELEAFIGKFLDNNKDWSKNAEILEETNTRFRQELSSLLKNNDSIFYDYAMELTQVTEYSGEPIGTFKNWGEFPNSSGKKIYVDLFVLADNQHLSTLEINKKYKVIGTFKSFVEEVDFESGLTVWSLKLP